MPIRTVRASSTLTPRELRAARRTRREELNDKKDALNAERRALEANLIVLTTQGIDLKEQETVAANRAQEYWDKAETELRYDPAHLITNLQQESHLGVAIKKLEQKINQYNQTNVSGDILRRTIKRHKKLSNRMKWRIEKLNDQYILLKEEADQNYAKVLGEYEAITAQLDDLVERRNGLTERLSEVIKEAEKLNTRRAGKSRKKKRKKKAK